MTEITPKIHELITYVMKTPSDKLEGINEKVNTIKASGVNSNLLKLIDTKINGKLLELLVLNIYPINIKYLDMVLHSLNITKDDINELANDHYNFVQNMTNIFGLNWPKSLTHLVLMTYCNFKLNLIETTEEYDELCLSLAYYTLNVPNVTFLLQRKLIPNKECFYCFVRGILKKYQHDKFLTSPEITELLNSFGTYGYKIDKDDFINLVESHIYIDPDNYEIVPDINFYIKCIDNVTVDYWRSTDSKMYIDYIAKKFPLIKPDVTVLYSACRNVNTTLVKTLITKFKIQPDEQCMEEASKSTKSLAIMNVLLGKGIKPNKACVLNMLRAFNNKPAALIADNF
jgi:hypothetical protein